MSLSLHLNHQDENGWSCGILNGKEGFFPSNYVRERHASGEDKESCDAAVETGKTRTMSIGFSLKKLLHHQIHLFIATSPTPKMGHLTTRLVRLSPL